jgi:hypothetical protein
MSLFKQLLLAICLFLVVAFSGSFMVSLESSRSQYINQLRSHAQDAATALALSLTPNIDDPAMVELMVSSIFDSGYYASIKVIDLAPTPCWSSAMPARQPGVPDWFVKLIGLEPAGGDAIVSRGWQQAARVEVISHPMFALAKLWQSALGSLGWLLLCGVVSAVLGALLLRRQLRPLDYMVAQSHAIARREFLSLPELPRTPELRRVVQAMNQMVELKPCSGAGRAQRKTAPSLPGQPDRAGQPALRDAAQCPGEQPGGGPRRLPAAVAGSGPGRPQRPPGRPARISCCRRWRAVASCLRRYPETHDLITRSRGGEFAVLAPGMVHDEAIKLAQALEANLQSLHETGASDVAPVACIGLVSFEPGDEPQALLSQADEALARAESQPRRAGYAWSRAAAQAVGSQQAWHSRLDQALSKGSSSCSSSRWWIARHRNASCITR